MNKKPLQKNQLDEWNRRTSSIEPEKYSMPFFHELLKDRLPNGEGKACIELGAIPGNYLVYFNKQFGYSITGLDFSVNKKIFFDVMNMNGIKNFDFISEDITEYTPRKKYDLVTSFGFIEHFNDIEEILSKHVEFMSDNGKLLVTVPNFRYFQWLYHRIFDPRNLAFHNLEAMDTKKIDIYLNRMGLKKILAQPYGYAQFWFEDVIDNFFIWKTRNITTKLFNKILAKSCNNPLFAPFTVFYYEKKLPKP